MRKPSLGKPDNLPLLSCTQPDLPGQIGAGVGITTNGKEIRRKTPPCYSRTCPVLISHPGASGSYEGLAILDDQSSIPFVDPAVGQVLDIPVSSTRTSTQSTITIEGQSRPQPCKIIHGLIITPLDGRRAIKLPPVVMQHSIPDSVDQVPSPEDVAETVGFQHLAGYFPKRTLIGRHCF